jgi:integrase
MAEKKAQRAAEKAKSVPPLILNPFRKVALEWFAQWKAGKVERHALYIERRLEVDILARIGDRPIDEIKPPEIVEMILAIESRGAEDVARRALQIANSIFRYGIARGTNHQNPAGAFKPKDVLKTVKTVNFARIGRSELPSLLHAIEFYEGSPLTRLALKLMSLVFLRTSELIAGEWKEINWAEARWDLPKEKMKGGKRPHVVPLSRQALRVLEELRNYGKNDRWLFPGDRDRKKHMSNNTILKALERMGFKGKMTGHGFRGVASTLLHEQGYEHEHIELQLHHGPEDDVSAAYNYAKYIEPRKRMMQDWADFLEKARTRKPVAVVSPVSPEQPTDIIAPVLANPQRTPIQSEKPARAYQ